MAFWGESETKSAGSHRKHKKAIRRQDIAEITSQLAIMTRSGVDIASALGSLASQCQREGLAWVLSEVHEAVLAGNALSDALKHHSDVFEPAFIATVAAGEASGRMSEVLDQLAHMQRNEIRSRRTIRAMMTYPVLLLMVSSSVLVALVMFVLPRFCRYLCSIRNHSSSHHSNADQLSRRVVGTMVAVGPTGVWLNSFLLHLAENKSWSAQY